MLIGLWLALKRGAGTVKIKSLQGLLVLEDSWSQIVTQQPAGTSLI